MTNVDRAIVDHRDAYGTFEDYRRTSTDVWNAKLTGNEHFGQFVTSIQDVADRTGYSGFLQGVDPALRKQLMRHQPSVQPAKGGMRGPIGQTSLLSTLF